jgi:Chaperone of endosialidase
MRFRIRFSFPLIVAVLFPFIALAADASRQPTGMHVANPTSVEWKLDHTGAVLSVQRPDGEVFTETFAAGQSPSLRLDGFTDGAYSWELRGGADVQSGTFTIANGAIVPPDIPENLRAGRPLRPATDTFFADDVSAAGGVCAGTDCTNAEVYGFASIKMKENNTRIKFEDTSASVGFATTDWQISANDTTSGGANKLFVEDLTAATVPFLIEGGSPTNTLYVDSNGRVGIRTSTPARDLTIANPVSTIIRMEQSASPFQAWDIVANNNNFYVRDVNHEQNPFIIKQSAPYYSLVIESTSGNIGLGVATPLYPVHHSSGARLEAGNWTNASSRAIKQDIHELDRKTAFDALKSLQPMTYAYKANPTDTQVGFIAEDVPELVATPDRKGLSSMDVVAVLTKVIQEQQKTIEEMRGRLERLEERQ